MDSDLDSDSILSMGWDGFQICEILWIWIKFWIKFCPCVGSGFKSVKFYGFGFKIVHGLGWVSNL